jgi:hypothetical protein
MKRHSLALGLTIVRQCSKLTIPVHRFWGIISDMKKEVDRKQILVVHCPTCGAAPGEKCELSTGQPRTNPHRDRRVIAKDSQT